MNYLGFERAYALESRLCETCHGSGIATRMTPRMSPACWYCRGLGRRITAAGRRVFAELAQLLGRPVTKPESRIDPRHLDYIFGSQVRSGMRIARQAPPIAEFRTLDEQSARDIAVRDRLTLFRRELTEPELVRVDELMASRVGTGTAKS